MDNPRTVGHVVSVSGFRVKVEILKEARSPSRATLDGVQTAVAINAYLTFSIGAGQTIIGIVTDLDARESYDPSSGEELSLELLKARRVLEVQLLGTAELGGKDKNSKKVWRFNPGITILPTLDTPAEVGTPDIMAAILENPPQRNKPDYYKKHDDNYDYGLAIGSLTGDKSKKVKASYNDLFSRPLAIVGNTGSGKSYSVASLLQKAMDDRTLGKGKRNAPHIFILDINGEYTPAFLSGRAVRKSKQPNHIYLNGKEFGIPLWFFNAQEICAWLSAAEQTQEPVLKDWWAVVKNVKSADSPLFIKRESLLAPELIARGVSVSDQKQIDAHLTTLKLRLRARLDDKRWHSFLNYQVKNKIGCPDLKNWLNRFDFNNSIAQRVSVIDLSMLSHEALPYACGVIGRILLETREHLDAQERYKNPWVLVLEEAHNYARPYRQNEEKGQELSRTAFERIAKEGRKFGLSLIVASQRPSEISPTIISQCANFINHRLQNPDDIDHFRKIIPMQARRLLDQVTVLASGEAVVFGSAFHIPARVQIDIPDPEPWSQTSAPFYEWKNNDKGFPLDSVIEKWVGDISAPAPALLPAPAPEQE